MPSWFSVLVPVTLSFVAPPEVPLDVEIDALRGVDATERGAPALAAFTEVLSETARFAAEGDAPVTVTLVAVTTEVRRSGTEVVGTFRTTDAAGAVLDEVTLTEPDLVALGRRYGQRIAPHATTAERWLYPTGSPGLREAMGQVAADDWDAASATWREVVLSGSPRDVARARHNLAVSAERANRLDRALQLSRNAAPELGATNDRYVLALEQRWRDAKLLQQQLSGNDATAER
ncbi:MAG: DUF6340 family protein [Myxococcota bacterium]